MKQKSEWRAKDREWRRGQRAIADALRGRTVRRCVLHFFDTGQSQHPTSASPRLTLDDGSVLWFNVAETDNGEYGVELVLQQPGSSPP